jgi:hypothetical protein
MSKWAGLINLLDPNNRQSFNQIFRHRRFLFFLQQLEKLGNDKQISILDVGGVEAYWVNMDILSLKKNISITLLNLDKVNVTYPVFSSVAGDAGNLSAFENKSFDIVFSNSVIEHLYTLDQQKKMAEEVQRVGINYFIQTPNYWFPFEPHWLFPFFQFLPFKIKVWLTLNFNLGHYPKATSKEAAILRVNEVKLLTVAEMKKLFPGGKIYKERFTGFVKSITAYSFSHL